MERSARRKRSIAPVALVLAGLILGACSNAPSKATPTGAPAPKASLPASTDPGDSPYCNALMTWGAYDWFKPGGEGFPGEPGKPLAGQPGAVEANKAYQQKYLEFATRARQLAPPEIRDAWDTYFAMGTGPWTALLESVGYDLTNPKILAAMNDPPASLQAGMQAFGEQIQPYENRVCGSGQPPPADVKFSGKPDSEFCQTQLGRDEAFQSIVLDGTKPADVEVFVTSSSQQDSLARLEQSAPDEIKADVIATNTFWAQKQVPLIEQYGYDFPKLIATGSSVERHVINSATPDIAESTARVEAYVGQVCGSEG
jgi:hypothetical protein